MEATRRISVQLNGGASRISPRDRDAAIEVVPSNRAFQGISPIWDSESHALFWADKLAPSIQMSGRREWTMTFGERSNPIDAAILGPQDVAVLIAGHMLRISHNRIVGERAMPNLTGVRAIQPDPHGTLWAAIASEQAGTTTFARLTKEGNLEEPCSLPGEIGNFAWDRSGERVYATDPAKGAVFALDVKAKRARIFARIPKASGLPAGLATDVDGRVWVALYDGWSVVRLDADGEFESVLALPVPRPTALAFGGADGTTLYITTASIGLPIDILENAPLSGHVLSTVTSVRGYVVPLAEYVI
jgi:sugar lactone lactonase YvrE